MIAAHAAEAWLAGGLVLLAAEALLPGIFLMWLGIAALGTGLVALLADPAFAWQVVAFALFAALTVGLALRLRRARPPARLNTAESGLVGRAATVLAFQGREGRVRVGDSDWSARLADGAPAPERGSRLRVLAVEGTMLVVGEPGAESLRKTG